MSASNGDPGLFIYIQSASEIGRIVNFISVESVQTWTISREFSRDTCVSQQLRSFLPAFDPLTLVLNTPLGFLIVVEAQP